MSVLYYSTGGDQWTECSAPQLLDEDIANSLCSLLVTGFESNSNAWLTSGSECGWGGLVCNADGFMTRIDMGT